MSQHRFINDGLRLALAREIVGDHLEPGDVLTTAEQDELKHWLASIEAYESLDSSIAA